jgi:hypothetical protein
LKNQEVAIKKVANKPLSKNQVAFNKFTKKIEALQLAIDKKKLQLDVAIDCYAKEFFPATQTLQQNRKLYIIQLWQLYKNQSFAKTEQRHLKQYIQAQLDNYLDDLLGLLEEDMHQLFEEIEGINYQQLLNEQKNEMLDELKKALAAYKVVLTKKDMENEEILYGKLVEAKLKHKQEELNKETASNKKKPTTKNRRQEEYLQQQAAINEAKKKSVSSIYKQLAKLFHPDVEQDVERRAEKEVLMKQLNEAYQNKDLHALLLLELKWINKEKDHLTTLADNTLDVYLLVLKEQISLLEEEKNNLIYLPRYRVLEEKFGPQMVQYPIEMVRHYITIIKKNLSEVKDNIDHVNSPLALKHLKSTLKKWVHTKRQMMEEEAMYAAFWNGRK